MSFSRYTAFDFETASGKNPCSIGIVEFERGKVVDTYYSLINPEIDEFNPFTTKIHGISEADVRNEKTFDDIWLEINHFFENKKIVAHNSSFDLSVLHYSLNRYDIAIPETRCFCTMRISKQFLELSNYKLSSLAKYYKIPQNNYHNALEDAQICGLVFQKLTNQIDDMESFENSNLYKLGKSPKRRIRENASKTNSAIAYYKSKNEIKIKLSKESLVLSGKKIVVTGVFFSLTREELKLIILRNGGKVGSSISSKTAFLVAGDKMGPSKRTKAENLGVPIISEQDFLDMVD